MGQQRSSGSTAPPDQKPTSKEDGLDLCDVLLKGLPAGLKQDGLRAWVEERLPGGAGIENIRSVGGAGGAQEATPASGSSFTVRFRREANARRAVEALGDSELKGHKVSATFRSLEMSRQSAKGGRLIVRNLAFGATEKHVRKAFAELGELTDVHLPLKNGESASGAGGSPAHRGFAFVQYADSHVSERAVSELNGIKICGRGVAVDWAMDAKLYGAVVREEDRKKTKKGEPAEQSGKTDNGGHEKDDKSEEEEESDEDDEEDSEDEDEEEEEDEDEEAAKKEVR